MAVKKNCRVMDMAPAGRRRKAPTAVSAANRAHRISIRVWFLIFIPPL